MPRRLRVSKGDIVYHVINRRAGRSDLFAKSEDYAAFEAVLAKAVEQFSMRLISYCLMPNHWHLVLWPRRDADLSRFMQWLSVTHMRRWHAHRHSVGTGPLYQGRFKSFPIQQDEHFRIVCRYVERNSVRANLAKRAEDWPWCSAAKRKKEHPQWLLRQEDWPVEAGKDWSRWVNAAATDKELEALRRSVNRGVPFGDEPWQKQTARRLKLESSLRPPWRPKKQQLKKERRGGIK